MIVSLQIRQRVQAGTRRQAAEMIRRSPAPAPARINDSVTVPIPAVDRPGKMAMSNAVGVVVGTRETANGALYEVATTYGRIRPLLSRTQFELASRPDLLDRRDVNEEQTVTMRKLGILQGGSVVTPTVKCYCNTDFCRSRRCLCRRNGQLCTSHCRHGRDHRTGKIDPEAAPRCTNK